MAGPQPKKLNYSTLRVCSVNINGLSRTTKKHQLNSFLVENKIHVCILQEFCIHHSTGNAAYPQFRTQFFPTYVPYYHHHSTVILIDKHILCWHI